MKKRVGAEARGSIALLLLLSFTATAPRPAAAQQQPTAPSTMPSPRNERSLDPKLAERARSLNMKLRCPICAGASIEESPAAQAVEMKKVVREQVVAGKSDAEIEQYFVARYGEWILLAPPARGINLLVYLLPLALVLGGGIFVYKTARKWTRA
ncbi:MAG: cytochrome c-type biogenesis protein CcmH [Longimicrobiales bacterium]